MRAKKHKTEQNIFNNTVSMSVRRSTHNYPRVFHLTVSERFFLGWGCGGVGVGVGVGV